MKALVLLTVCAWCNRIRTRQGEWCDAEEGDSRGPRTTHGICPECLERATARATMAATVSG